MHRYESKVQLYFMDVIQTEKLRNGKKIFQVIELTIRMKVAGHCRLAQPSSRLTAATSDEPVYFLGPTFLDLSRIF
jgi:hypothetical protein